MPGWSAVGTGRTRGEISLAFRGVLFMDKLPEFGIRDFVKSVGAPDGNLAISATLEYDVIGEIVKDRLS